MTQTEPRPAAVGPSRAPRSTTRVQVAIALVCGLLGFLLVAQVRTNEVGLGERLAGEREEDLARILSDLSTQSDRLQSELTDLRLTLLMFEDTAQQEDFARRSLERRLADLQVLVGTVPVEGEGIVLTARDPDGQVTQELLVDVVQELRDAGAEAIAVNGIRLVAASAFTTRNNRLLLDGQPLSHPYRVAAIGVADTLAKAMAFPGGAQDAFSLRTGVSVTVEPLAELTIPARAEPSAFVYGTPVPADREASAAPAPGGAAADVGLSDDGDAVPAAGR